MISAGKENRYVKLYSKLSAEKKFRLEEGMFAVEGEKIILDAINENAELCCALVTEEAAMKYSKAVSFLEEKLKDRVLIISRETSEKLSDTKTPQGIFAVVKRLDKIFTADKIKKNGKYLVLNGLQDPGNVGTILRTADAVGTDGVFITKGSVDLYNPKTIRSTMGSLFRLETYDNCDYYELICTLKSRGIKTFAAVIDKDAQDIKECGFTGGCAAVIGNEGNGLSERDASMCDKKITIKMNGNINSLNAAMASGIILWEMFR